MEMNVDKYLVLNERTSRAWSQQQLADISSLSLRTIQRIEKTGIASKDSLQSISSAFDKKPSYFFSSTEELAPRKNTSKILAFCFSILTISIAGLYLARVSAETIELNIDYKSENISSHEINEGSWNYLATVGSSSELSLPNDFTLMIHPKNKYGGELTFDLSLINASGESLIPNHESTTVVGSLNDRVKITYEKDGKLLVTIYVNAVKL